MPPHRNQLLNTLISQNVLTAQTAADLEKRALAAHTTPEELLVAEGVIDDEQLAQLRAKAASLPYVSLRDQTIPQKLLKMIPREAAENYQVIAFRKEGNVLDVGLVNPQNFKAIEAIQFLAQKSNLKVRYFVISRSSFQAATRRYQQFGEEVQAALENIREGPLLDMREGAIDRGKMEEVVRSAPVSKVVLVIIRHAIDGGASDIHIEPSIKETRVRYRIDGILRTSLVLPKYIHSAIIARIKVLANLRLDESRIPQDGRFRLTIEEKDFDFRVSNLPLFEGEKVVLRILHSSDKVPTLENLGFNPTHIALVDRNIKKPHGLLLVTGPTGSGKTTTLYVVLNMLNVEDVNIVTLEDPIEYYVSGINQSQIRPEVGYTFASGLRSMLRQDPNIIMLGEIRDKETTDLVIQASLTGHKQLTTLHPTGALGWIPGRLDMGAEPFLLASVINMTIAQRLARKICPDCKQEDDHVNDALLKRVRDQMVGIPAKYLEGLGVSGKPVFWRGAGCARCGNLGYRDRLAAAEIINITPEISDIISQGKDLDRIKEELKKQDFITLTQDCLIKALQGQTTLDEVIRVSQL